MSLSCYCESDDADWYYDGPDDFEILNTKRSRKCCSCKKQIKPGDTVIRFHRWRSPSDRCNFIEESIYGEEVPLAPWFMCETCGGLFLAIHEAGMCCDIEENMAEQIKEYRDAERAA